MRIVRSVDDLAAEEVEHVLRRADEHRSGRATPAVPAGTVVGLAFLSASLRTRVGFATAAARLGATPVEVAGLRQSRVSMAESVADTLRTLAGYCDIVVARVDEPFTPPVGGRALAMLNGGDTGPLAEHPSQALIDLYALNQLDIPLTSQTVAICGDLRMRSARSLLSLLATKPPKRIRLLTDRLLLEGFSPPPELATVLEDGHLDDLGDVDALYVVGIPHGAIDEPHRTRLRVTVAHLDRLPGHAGVFSPMPIIDEMELSATFHRAVRMFEQSDTGLFVRMALLELLLKGGPSSDR